MPHTRLSGAPAQTGGGARFSGFPDDLDARFAEIEYEAAVGGLPSEDTERRFFASLPAPLPIKHNDISPVRRRFLAMRAIAANAPYYREDRVTFRRQAEYMEDFTDFYEAESPFAVYYPNYRIMTDEQLRTYFSWRADVRRGVLRRADLSYVFLHIYELLSGIGTDNPRDGLDKLTDIWTAYRAREPALDNYMPQWLHDYYVCYEVPDDFAAYVQNAGLREHYPEYCRPLRDGDESALWHRSSDYDITRSKFYAGSNIALFHSCARAVLPRIKDVLAENGLGRVFSRYGLQCPWLPFSRSPASCAAAQRDREVSTPRGEKYICENNAWKVHTTIRTTGEKSIIGYIIKKTESCLREAVGCKHKLTLNQSKVLRSLRCYLPSVSAAESALVLGKIDRAVNSAVAAFLAERNRVTITLDGGGLARIRSEAAVIREKLTVRDTETHPAPAPVPPSRVAAPQVAENAWASLKNALNIAEHEALRAALRGTPDIRHIAYTHGTMPEVLADGINEKAADILGDCLVELGERLTVYPDYAALAAEMAGCS
ncbi:MAG: TerB N-terminal domain-containing protein [Oscillospiraceae bacterium]|jgi:hypothetical protein|nr:TerB N-terminal domain-containing protein [Oscillospiraceae bacterium]